jgi:hypothetical protein
VVKFCFGCAFWQLRATGVASVAARRFIVLFSLACIAPFGVTEFENVKSSLSLFSGWAKQVAKFCFGWDFHIMFGHFAPAVEGKGPARCNGM